MAQKNRKKTEDRDMEALLKNTRTTIRRNYTIDKVEYYDKINWGVVIFDLAVLVLIGVTRNYWLIILLLISGNYKIKKWDYVEN